METKTEETVLRLITADKLHIPFASLEGKLKRLKPKIASGIDLPTGSYQGQRAYARVVIEDQLKSRSMSEAVDEFCTKYPTHAVVLTQMIEDKRSEKETHLYFGMNEGCRLTADDYLGVLNALGLSQAQARNLYGPIMDASNSIARKRAEERSLLIG